MSTRPRQKSLVLILARELTTHLATPVFLVDPDGTLVYFNEAAEPILGQRFDEVGEIGPEDWGTRWAPEDLEGRPIPLEDLPLSIALYRHEAANGRLRITGADGVKRTIDVIALPLFAHADGFVGAAVIFWESQA